MSTDEDRAPLAEAEAADAPVGRRSRVRRWSVVTGALALPMLALALWWFEPQALLFDDVVDEAFPLDAAVGPAAEDAPPAEPDEATTDAVQGDDTATATDEASAEPTPAASGPVEFGTGMFVSRNRYTVTGTATTFELEDGARLLRLEDFESTNGPDLFVYLTVAGADDGDDALDADFVDLGPLSGNIGNQNYVIPADVDLDRYDSVVIWCRRFTTSFGVADLSPAPA